MNRIYPCRKSVADALESFADVVDNLADALGNIADSVGNNFPARKIELSPDVSGRKPE